MLRICQKEGLILSTTKRKIARDRLQSLARPREKEKRKTKRGHFKEDVRVVARESLYD